MTKKHILFHFEEFVIYKENIIIRTWSECPVQNTAHKNETFQTLDATPQLATRPMIRLTLRKSISCKARLLFIFSRCLISNCMLQVYLLEDREECAHESRQGWILGKEFVLSVESRKIPLLRERILCTLPRWPPSRDSIQKRATGESLAIQTHIPSPPFRETCGNAISEPVNFTFPANSIAFYFLFISSL